MALSYIEDGMRVTRRLMVAHLGPDYKNFVYDRAVAHRKTYSHVLRVATMGRMTLEPSRMSADKKARIIPAVALALFGHDIGKEEIDPMVLDFPGRFNAAQRQEMGRHPDLGRRTLYAAALALRAKGHPLADDFIIMTTVASRHHDYGWTKPEDRSLSEYTNWGITRGAQIFDRFDGMTSRLEERAYLEERLAGADGLGRIEIIDGRKTLLHDFEGIAETILQDYPEPIVPVFGCSPEALLYHARIAKFPEMALAA